MRHRARPLFSVLPCVAIWGLLVRVAGADFPLQDEGSSASLRQREIAENGRACVAAKAVSPAVSAAGVSVEPVPTAAVGRSSRRLGEFASARDDHIRWGGDARFCF